MSSMCDGICHATVLNRDSLDLKEPQEVLLDVVSTAASITFQSYTNHLDHVGVSSQILYFKSSGAWKPSKSLVIFECSVNILRLENLGSLGTNQ